MPYLIPMLNLMIASTGVQAADKALIQNEAGVLAVLLVVLAVIFWLAKHPVSGRFFRIVPALVFCYFVPTLLATLGVIPHESALYDWIKTYVLPASLLLLILALDLPAVARLGWKSIVMLLSGTLGVVVGGPIALWLLKGTLEPGTLGDTWKGMAALSGSWIGGGANYVAMGQIAGASDAMLGLMVIPDVLIANIWLGVLLFSSGRQRTIDRWTGADTSAIDALQKKMEAFHEQVARHATVGDLIMLLALAFGVAYIGYEVGNAIPAWLAHFGWGEAINKVLPGTAWKFILVTSVGLVLSFSPARKLEGVGASRLGSVFIYLLVACIGASASFAVMDEAKPLIVIGAVWMLCHVAFLLLMAWLIKAPLFLVAVGSQANIGGAASAPVVASAFHPALAPVGALMAVVGYVLGTYAGIVCMKLLQWAAGAG